MKEDRTNEILREGNVGGRSSSSTCCSSLDPGKMSIHPEMEKGRG